MGGDSDGDGEEDAGSTELALWATPSPFLPAGEPPLHPPPGPAPFSTQHAKPAPAAPPSLPVLVAKST